MSSNPSTPLKAPTITISSMDFENQGPIHSKRSSMSIITKRSSRNLLLLVVLLTTAIFVSNSWSDPDLGVPEYQPQSYFEQQPVGSRPHSEQLGFQPPIDHKDGFPSDPSTMSNDSPAVGQLADPSLLPSVNWDEFANATIGKVTMLYGDSNPVYERALQSHVDHGKVHGYPVHVLRQKILGRLWSKPAYILSIILNELQKPREEQLQWLFWFDADTVLINPKIPLDIFLPPSPDYDHIHFLCGNDHNGLNDGAFLLRIGDYSMHLMAAALSVEGFRPDVSLKYSEQSAIEHVIHSNDLVRPWEGFSYNDGYAEIPQRWMNAYMGPRLEDGTIKPKKQLTGNSVREGDMLVHFAGSGETKRRRMTKFMDTLDKDRSAWEIDPQETEYDDEIKQFWIDFGKLEAARFEEEQKKIDAEVGASAAGAKSTGKTTDKVSDKRPEKTTTTTSAKTTNDRPKVDDSSEDKDSDSADSDYDADSGKDDEPAAATAAADSLDSTGSLPAAVLATIPNPASAAAAAADAFDLEPTADKGEDSYTAAPAAAAAPTPTYVYPPVAAAPAAAAALEAAAERQEFRMGKIRRIGKH